MFVDVQYIFINTYMKDINVSCMVWGLFFWYCLHPSRECLYCKHILSVAETVG